MTIEIDYVFLFALLIAVVIGVVWYKNRYPEPPDMFTSRRPENKPVGRALQGRRAEPPEIRSLQQPAGGKPSGQKVLFSKAKDEEWEAYKDRIVESLGKRGFLSRGK